jgi:hypothetical protein
MLRNEYSILGVAHDVEEWSKYTLVVLVRCNFMKGSVFSPRQIKKDPVASNMKHASLNILTSIHPEHFLPPSFFTVRRATIQHAAESNVDALTDHA